MLKGSERRPDSGAPGPAVRGSECRDPRGVITEILLDELWCEAVKSGGDRRVGGENIPGARGGQGRIEGLLRLAHEGACALQDRQSSMPLVQVAHVGLNAQRLEQPPASNPQHHFLLQPHLGPPP